MQAIKYVLTRMGLTLNEQKTKIVNACKESFNFLGFEHIMRENKRTGKSYARTQPSKKSMQKIKKEITRVTRRKIKLVPLDDLISKINMTLRGWVNYFHYGNCRDRLIQLRRHTELRVYTHLRKRHNIRDRWSGYKRFPDWKLYAAYGLYKVPTTEGWKKRMLCDEEHRKAVCGKIARTV